MDSYLRFGDLFGQSGWEEKMGAKGEREMGNRGREIYMRWRGPDLEIFAATVPGARWR